MDVRKVECQTLIIGAGTAGIEAYKSAVENGQDCVIVDSGPLGTTAQRSGELPVSLLMDAGLSLHAIENLVNAVFPLPQKLSLILPT